MNAVINALKCKRLTSIQTTNRNKLMKFIANSDSWGAHCFVSSSFFVFNTNVFECYSVIQIIICWTLNHTHAHTDTTTPPNRRHLSPFPFPKPGDFPRKWNRVSERIMDNAKDFASTLVLSRCKVFFSIGKSAFCSYS